MPAVFKLEVLVEVVEVWREGALPGQSRGTEREEEEEEKKKTKKRRRKKKETKWIRSTAVD